MVAMAIEQTVNLRELTIEELTGRFSTAEEGYELDDITDGVGRLLLTEEEWAARHRQRGGTSGGTKPAPKPKPQGNQGGGSSSGDKGTGSGERKKGNCRYCGKAGHWAKECRKAKRDRERGIAANLAEVEEEEEEASLLMAVEPAAIANVHTTPSSTGEQVFLNEERARIELRRHDHDADTAWYLDTGASNHMTGDEHVFAEISRKVTRTVRFGDGSLVEIQGRGTVMFSVDGGRHCRWNGYRGIPVHLLLGHIIGPSSAQGRINNPSYGEDPHEETPREENDDGNH
jgi:hypothetical protein